ncbi:MAG: hypothetical protein AABW85_01885 [archaeon]
MNKDEVLVALARMRDFSKKRGFEQSVDLCLNFAGIDFKKPENRIDVDVTFPNPTGKQGAAKVLVFVRDKAFAEQLEGKVTVILEQDIPNIKGKQVDGLLKEYDMFLAEGGSVLTVAKHLGQQLAPKGKMPKPITSNLKEFENALAKASTSVKITNSKGKFMPLVHVMVGKEKDSDEKIAENIFAVYNTVLTSLGENRQSIKSSRVKLTMGPSIKIGLSKEDTEAMRQKILAKEKSGSKKGEAK